MITRTAPGKLFVAGEYAVLEPGCPAVLVAVDRYATVTVTAINGPTALSSDRAGELVLPRRPSSQSLGGRPNRPTNEPHVESDVEAAKSGSFSYVLSAVRVVERLVAERGMPTCCFHLSISTDLAAPDGRKLGLGSSGAVTVATCDALARFYRLRLGREELYRLAMLATLAVAPDASGGDVAASVFGGWLLYCAPDRQSVASLADGGGIAAALDAPWRGLTLQPLPAPVAAHLEVGWTGEPAATTDQVRRLLDGRYRAAHHRTFLNVSTDCVSTLVYWLTHGDVTRMQEQIRCARHVLGALDRQMSLGWMTPRLRALCAAADAIGAAAKPSGAGGGDCGIALLRRDQQHQVAELHDRWKREGVQPLDLRVHPTEQDLT
ncbi:phosphomevalonate kinase [Actinomadura rudentiformis]|uniref:phosphomevalonate kinase n=1 Tax=Actinomadura rudentiformis TaxID=359158 RepID=A0A6H9YJA0_9ACTN|nr:phosphomevalonate kinase [Actinomadura rudentiformis]KAB2346913.1 phosphomevalonate kinase [Actinomadura rudentiformis]